MRVLVGVDGSKNALEAVTSLVKHAGWFRKPPSVELLTVHPPMSTLVRAGLGITKSELAGWYRGQGEANLAAAKKMLQRARLQYRPKILVGPVAETLVQHARRAGCDLIVIGASGMGAAGSLLAASVATKVLHLSTLPVLVAR